MLPPQPGAPAIEHLELHLWRMMPGRSAAIGERRFRLLVRLVVRFWPFDQLERIRRAGHWSGAERKRTGRITAARVREVAEAMDPEMADAWPIVIEGTVALVWSAICHLHAHDLDLRAALPDLSAWVASHGAVPVDRP